MISASASSTTLRVLENGDALAGRGGQIDLVGADAERADRDEVGRRPQDRSRHAGLGSDAEQRDAGDALQKLVLVQPTLVGFHDESFGLQT
jgi:hypothetical protein